MKTPSIPASAFFLRRAGAALPAVAAVSVIACSPPPPRGYDFFMEDSIARDGVIARCDQDPAASTDIECANARRAAMAIQLRDERDRRERLERESAAKIEALRREFEAQRRAAREAEAAAAAAAARYDPERESEQGVLELSPAGAADGQPLAVDADPGQPAGIVPSAGSAQPPVEVPDGAILSQPGVAPQPGLAPQPASPGAGTPQPAGATGVAPQPGASPQSGGGATESTQGAAADSASSGSTSSAGAPGQDTSAAEAAVEAGAGLGIPRPFQPSAAQPGAAESAEDAANR